MSEIREGRIEQTIDALAAARDRAPADAQLAIDERIAMLYLAAYRWRDAIAHAEAHLFDAPPPAGRRGLAARARSAFAPPVWVELLGAYGRTGDLDQAARMLARLEDVCAGRDDAALWIHRARVMFLALAGRIDAVRALVVAAPGAPHERGGADLLDRGRARAPRRARRGRRRVRARRARGRAAGRAS